MIPLIFCILFFVVQNSNHVFGQSPVVETEVGSIRGVRADDGDYSMYMGIPYATVNDTNVFGDAIPQPPFEGIFDAIDDSAICPQIEEFNFTYVGNLDCLHLNIYVPDAVNVSRPLPVMVYIHGGIFNVGFAGRFLYGPRYIVRHDVILVTFNYRLGPYGFFCLDTPEVSGNQGLKDQVLALKWVRQNVGAFGGDPNRVTIFGNSAGAMSADYHLISNLETVFSNVILQSGSALISSYNLPNPSSLFQLAASLGLQTNDTNAALSFLSQINPEMLITTAHDLYYSASLCIESSRYQEVTTFINNYPGNINDRSLRDISVMIGLNSDEMLSMFSNRDPDFYPSLKMLFRANLQSILNLNETDLNELSDIIRRFYIGDKEFSIDVRDQLLEYVSDNTFNYPVFRRIEKYLNNDVENVFFYWFSYDGGRNFVKRKDNVTEPGVCHADEIGYLFDMEFIPGVVTAEDQLIIDRMTAMWTNFAKYDNPTPETTPLLPVKWIPITKDSGNTYLNIDIRMSQGDNFLHERMSFLDLFFTRYGEHEIGFGFVPEESIGQEETVDPGGPSSASKLLVAIVLCVVVILANLLNRKII